MLLKILCTTVFILSVRLGTGGCFRALSANNVPGSPNEQRYTEHIDIRVIILVQ